jgi:catechol 2,3-dioxygenase-like lactoylglutathione lyase family enzyme
MIMGLNHITLAVRDVEESCAFYADVLRCRLAARWVGGAYLVAGDVWIALVLDPLTRRASLPEYTHIAFSVDEHEFPVVSRRIRDAGARIWQDNESEGASLYFEDPNGHKLEVHVGDLASRLVNARQNAWPGLVILEPEA